MKATLFNQTAVLSCVVAITLLAGGCDPQAKEPSDDPAPAAETSHDDHSGWWCPRHGIPEEECAMCKTKLAAEYREKGDWCEEHTRPDSLCFKCNPGYAEKYAKLYEAKFGHAPPKPTE